MILPKCISNNSSPSKRRGGPNLDLKRQLPTAWDGDAKHELFADVSAFANAGGGDLIYGMEEDDEGRATALVPLQDNSDETTLRIADLLMTGIEQRIPGMQVQPVPVTAGGVAGTVFVIQVPLTITAASADARRQRVLNIRSSLLHYAAIPSCVEVVNLARKIHSFSLR